MKVYKLTKREIEKEFKRLGIPEEEKRKALEEYRKDEKGWNKHPRITIKEGMRNEKLLVRSSFLYRKTRAGLRGV